MKPAIKETIISYFYSLQSFNGALLMSVEQKTTFVKNLRNLWGEKSLNRTEFICITTWLDSIELGDLGNRCACYYFNFDNNRLNNLKDMLKSFVDK